MGSSHLQGWGLFVCLFVLTFLLISQELAVDILTVCCEVSPERYAETLDYLLMWATSFSTLVHLTFHGKEHTISALLLLSGMFIFGHQKCTDEMLYVTSHVCLQ